MSLQFENAAAEPVNQQATIWHPMQISHKRMSQREVLRLEFREAGEGGVVAKDAGNIEEADAAADMAEMLTASATPMPPENTETLIHAAIEEARSELRKEWEDELSARVTTERSEVLRVCERFKAERERYFDTIEQEVVKLALAVAGRVLHREVKLDPMLLAAAVRVALEKMADGTNVTLRVPAADASAWRAIISETTESEIELVGDDSITSGECVIETGVGKVDLGVNAQLVEIERGFFDLLQRRPE